jgi:protein arginine kinase activator
MLCDVCKSQKANVFLTQIVEGKMQKVNMCESCSKEKGVADPTGFALADMLLGLGAAQTVEGPRADSCKCAVCGFTQTEFKKTGRLGCSGCYTTFAESLAPMLRGMHKGVEHVGKVPERQMRALRKEQEIKACLQEMRQAIAAERYEEAAALRDRIRQMEEEVCQGGGGAEIFKGD